MGSSSKLLFPAIRGLTSLRSILEDKIPEKQQSLLQLKKEHGSKSLGEVRIARGGGVNGLDWTCQEMWWFQAAWLWSIFIYTLDVITHKRVLDLGLGYLGVNHSSRFGFCLLLCNYTHCGKAHLMVYNRMPEIQEQTCFLLFIR